MNSGYYLFPTIHNDKIVFVSDDNLWEAFATGGRAVRLTSLKAPPAHPYFSPNGEWIAFSALEEGHPEVYVIPVSGGEIRRLTYIGPAMTRVVGWTPDGCVAFISTVGAAFRSHSFVFKIHPEGGFPEKLPLGIASSVSYGPAGGVVLGRFGRDPAQWKRYRGGRMGVIWIDRQGDGRFQKLLELESNMTYPMWIGDRIYFMGDHEGWGNIYSTDLNGQDIHRCTHHDGIYVRNPRTDGKSIVYHAAGDLYKMDVASGDVRKIEMIFPSGRSQRSRRIINSGACVESYRLHPKGHSLAVASRGKPFTFAHWEGAVRQYGIRDCSARYRLTEWLTDGSRIIAVSDENSDEKLVIYDARTGAEIERFLQWDLGRIIEMVANPIKNQVAVSNQRQEIIIIDLDLRTMKTIDRSDWQRINGIAWSPDGRWLAYGFANSRKTSLIKLWSDGMDCPAGITQPVLRDYEPSFDPNGEYLYFLSMRVFDPVMDFVSFDYNFPKGVQPMLITLKKAAPSPFIPKPKAPGDEDKESAGTDSNSDKKTVSVEIDLEGILHRTLAIPAPEGRYSQIAGGNKKIFFLKSPVEGTLSEDWLETTPSANRILEFYDLEKQSIETFIGEVSSFTLSHSGKTLAYRSGNRLRALKADEKPDEKQAGAETTRKTGWIDLTRVKIEIDPGNEWLQMYRETWRLLRDHFHHADMSGVDWDSIYQKYLPLVERASTRFELSDLLWELGGEMGTSHCYEIGGDYPAYPHYPIGSLGADYALDTKSGHYQIEHIVRGDSWDEGKNSPLLAPGMNIQEGDLLTAVNGVATSPMHTPGRLLLGLAGQTVNITIQKPDGELRDYAVKTLRSEAGLRLRELINKTADYVHERTNGRVGYVYMEDMGSAGYSQFFRSFLAEVQREALIVDVRNNAGGHVSQLLLEKLARKRLGYDIPRYGKWSPIPTDSLLGPIVALTDEHSGSDGDIFSHTFKMMKLGLLIGTRTWGGIVGLNPTHPLVDGTMTTQPEFHNWFDDVGWNLENRGAEPDIIVDIAPQDYANGRDPQLERAIAEILRQLNEHPVREPKFGAHPNRKPPKLP